jgi:uncharacterized pyridoxamine 5'-phosphate oxidase family protein
MTLIITFSIQEIQYCYIRIRELISYLPDEYIEKLMQGVFLGLENIVEVEGNNETEVGSLSSEAAEIALLLRRHKGKSHRVRSKGEGWGFKNREERDLYG